MTALHQLTNAATLKSDWYSALLSVHLHGKDDSIQFSAKFNYTSVKNVFYISVILHEVLELLGTMQF